MAVCHAPAFRVIPQRRDRCKRGHMADLTWWRRRAAPLLGRRGDVERLFEAPTTWRILARFDRLLAFFPRVELTERHSAHVLVFDLPGLRRDDVDIRVDDENILTISGERRRPTGPAKTHGYSERRYGSFTRSIELPRGVDASRIEAFFRDGVLEIRVPKNDERRGRPVRVETIDASTESARYESVAS